MTSGLAYRLLRAAAGRRIYALTGDLAILSPFAVLPPSEESGGLFLGRDDRGRNVYLNPEKLPNMHGVILGTTGSGKSSLARHIMLEARRLGVTSWVIDPHSEATYRKLFERSFGLGDFRVNVLEAPGWGASELASELSRYIEAIYGFPGYRSILREILKRCFEEGSLEFFEKVSKEDPNLLRIYDDLSRIHSNEGASIAELTRDVYFYYPALVSREFLALSSQILLLLLEGYMRTKGARHRLEHLVVLEEAHLVKDYILSLFKQVRKYGWGLLAVTQLPREMDPRVYQLAGFLVVLSGPESFVLDVARVVQLTRLDYDHLLYSARGNALLVRQGDPRPRRIHLELHSSALS
ncbi:ATP-binding protein [Thermofilum pendens]|uniref:Helicase HerA central domain-containing protein n=1 Tax=Thermofilum pendens (strain DSM 2475 / Hrk 5) TaxID=368408 RepID=A1RY42_THEPD|nr:DUF87 domain-containing protein [Thermofilum pendens]ABL78122.1 hypothetical protein Tpen_0720 [Thermofilum pendens Hrk 5]